MYCTTRTKKLELFVTSSFVIKVLLRAWDGRGVTFATGTRQPMTKTTESISRIDVKNATPWWYTGIDVWCNFIGSTPQNADFISQWTNPAHTTHAILVMGSPSGGLIGKTMYRVDSIRSLICHCGLYVLSYFNDTVLFFCDQYIKHSCSRCRQWAAHQSNKIIPARQVLTMERETAISL